MTLWDVLQFDSMKHAYGVEEYRIRGMIDRGKIRPDDFARRTGTKEWIRVADIPATAWTDAVPGEEERLKRKHLRRAAKESGAIPKEPGLVPVEPPSSPPPPVVEPDHVDPQATTVFAPEHAAEGPTQAADFVLTKEPESLPGSLPRRPRIIAPPVRRARRQDDDDDAPFRASRVRSVEEPDLTSLVDVVFLLILFFMVTATFSLQKSLEIPSPKTDEQTAQQSPTLDDLRDDNIIIEVLADDSVLLNDRPVPMAELVELIRAEVRDTGLNEVILKASGQATHEAVVKAFDAANEVGVQRIRITSSSPEDEGTL